jgi:hypothetical protein
MREIESHRCICIDTHTHIHTSMALPKLPTPGNTIVSAVAISSGLLCMYVCIHVCMFICEREIKREINDKGGSLYLYTYVVMSCTS